MSWVDGCWEPSGQNWVWIRGGWLIAPQDAELFRGRVEVAADGSFLWHACTWVKKGRPIGWVEPLVPAATPLSQRTIYVPPA